MKLIRPVLEHHFFISLRTNFNYEEKMNPKFFVSIILTLFIVVNSTFSANIDDEKKDNLTPELIFEKYISALGGKDAILKVQDRYYVMNATFQDFEIEIAVYQKAPNKFLQSTSFAGQETYLVYDGEKGYQKSFMGDGDVEGSDLEMLMIDASLHFVANYQDFGIKFELLGEEKVAGKNSYKVKVILPSGASMTYYFDSETFLRVRESKIISTPQGSVSVDIDYLDFREVDGVKYPFSIIQSVGPMKLNFSVSGVQINKGISDDIFNKK